MNIINIQRRGTMMEMEKNQLIAVCGLNCRECQIFQASDNLEIAKAIADWFKKERDIEVKIEDIRCEGCKGDRPKHWSPDCQILKCCVDEKGLQFCFQCKDFPCEMLTEWAKGGERYREAIEQLKRMKEGS